MKRKSEQLPSPTPQIIRQAQKHKTQNYSTSNHSNNKRNGQVMYTTHSSKLS